MCKFSVQGLFLLSFCAAPLPVFFGLYLASGGGDAGLCAAEMSSSWPVRGLLVFPRWWLLACGLSYGLAVLPSSVLLVRVVDAAGAGVLAV